MPPNMPWDCHTHIIILGGYQNTYSYMFHPRVLLGGFADNTLYCHQITFPHLLQLNCVFPGLCFCPTFTRKLRPPQIWHSTSSPLSSSAPLVALPSELESLLSRLANPGPLDNGFLSASSRLSKPAEPGFRCAIVVNLSGFQ